MVAELYCDMPPEVVVDYVEAAHGTMTSVQLELLGAVSSSGRAPSRRSSDSDGPDAPTEWSASTQLSAIGSIGA